MKKPEEGNQTRVSHDSMGIIENLLAFLLPHHLFFLKISSNDSGHTVLLFCPLSEPLCRRCGGLYESLKSLTHSPQNECLSYRQELPVLDQGTVRRKF